MEVDSNENDDFQFDLVTIGAGSGGVRASRVAAGTYGAKVNSFFSIFFASDHKINSSHKFHGQSTFLIGI